MIEIYAQNWAATTGSNIVFSNKALQTGVTATLNAAGNAVQLNRPGIYRVDFNGYGAPTAAGNVGVQLVANNAAIVNAASEMTAGAGEEAAVSFSSLVTVGTAPTGNVATVAVQYTGAAGTMALANLIVSKIA